MRKAKAPGRIKADIDERTHDALVALAFRHGGAMDLQSLLDDVVDRHARRERAVRILKHDLHVASERAHLLETQSLQLVAHEDDRAVRGDQPQERKPERSLAGTGF